MTADFFFWKVAHGTREISSVDREFALLNKKLADVQVWEERVRGLRLRERGVGGDGEIGDAEMMCLRDGSCIGNRVSIQ